MKEAQSRRQTQHLPGIGMPLYLAVGLGDLGTSPVAFRVLTSSRKGHCLVPGAAKAQIH